jgi:hypothetical protein
MPAKKKSNPRKKETFALAKTEHEAVKDWLNSLSEDEFRDKILPEIFKQMKSQKLLSDFQNIHGRNDKGVDYILFENGPLSHRAIGIQVKSCEMTRASGANGAVTVRLECEAAMDHEFSHGGNKFRLDQIEVWNSGHTTQDAEAEFKTPGARYKIPIKTGDSLVHFVEKYAPKLLTSIPQYSVLIYIENEIKRNRRSFSLFGQRLNPHQHFLEPRFTPGSQIGLRSLETKKDGGLKPKNHKHLEDLLKGNGNIVITGEEMSGKSYCLERILGIARKYSANCIPVYFEEDEVSNLKAENLHSLIGKKVSNFNSKQVEALTERNQLLLLIDRIDLATKPFLEHLSNLPPEKYRIIGSARTFQSNQKFPTYNISGVASGSITRFIRNIDTKATSDVSFADRALNYVERALGALGLPATPFVVAACLRECHAGDNDLNTPTFGRLVARFIEDQAGSHNDCLRVDHEAKHSVLKEISSLNQETMAVEDVRKIIQSYITRSGSPHSMESFMADFNYSRLIETNSDNSLAKWCHPIYLKYYWLRHTMATGETHKVIDILKSKSEPTLSALYASEQHLCDEAVNVLLQELDQLQMPDSVDVIDLLGMEKLLLPDESEQDELLEGIEKLTEDEMILNESANDQPTKDDISIQPLPPEVREQAKKQLEFLFVRLHEEKFAASSNLSSILVNGRGTSLESKTRAIRAIFKSNARFGSLISEFIGKIFLDSQQAAKFKASWLTLFFELYLTDRAIGDTYLREVFRGMSEHDLSDKEKILLLDLQACCGVISDGDFISQVKSLDRIEITLVLYIRMLLLYYFRYQKPQEKKRLRDLLIQLSKIHKGINFAQLVPAS